MSEQLPTSAGEPTPARPTRSPAEIEAEIESTRQTLASTVDTLQDRLTPGAIVGAATSKVTGLFKRDDGSLDPVRTGAVAAVGLVLLVYLIRKRRL